MSLFTVRGAAVIRATIFLPLSGAWVADVDVETDAALEGRQSIAVDGGPTFVGAAVDGAVVHGLWQGRIVGGAGGIRRDLTPLAYRTATLADVVRDALREAGETLSSDSASLAQAAARWHRAAEPCAHTLAQVAEAAGYGWRVLLDGTVWFGTETWPAAPETDITVVDFDPRRGVYKLSGDTLGLRPGRLLQAQGEAGSDFVQMGDVRHEVTGDEITTTVWRAP